MRRLRRQEGQTLLMMMGISLAVLTMSGTLVAVTVNSRGATQDDRVRKQAFQVAEAGLDNALYMIGGSWPTLDSLDAEGHGEIVLSAGFEDRFPEPPAGQYFRSPKGAPLIRTWVEVSDDPNDTFPDDLLATSYWILYSQANVGNESACVRILVSRTSIGMNALIPGVALYAGRDLVGVACGVTVQQGQTLVGDDATFTLGVFNFTALGYPTALQYADSYTKFIASVNCNPAKLKAPVYSWDTYMPPSALAALKTYATDVTQTGTVTPAGGGNLTVGATGLTCPGPIRVNGDLILNGGGSGTLTVAGGIYVTGKVVNQSLTKVDAGGVYVEGEWQTPLSGAGVDFIQQRPVYVKGAVRMNCWRWGGSSSAKLQLLYCESNVTLSGYNVSIGTTAQPSIVYAKGNLTWGWALGVAFYGMMCCEGDCSTGAASGQVNGQLIVKRDVKPVFALLKVVYSQDVNNVIRTCAISSTKAASNSWEEVQPIPMDSPAPTPSP